MQRDLIFDIGMNDGEDAAFYLAKGFRVVGVEADPQVCAATAARLASAVASGALVIVNRAVSEIPGPITLYRNLKQSVWNTVHPAWVERNRRKGSASEAIEVEAITMAELFAVHGVPYVMKVDIEGSDLLCVRGLAEQPTRPRFVSIESSKESFAAVRAELALLTALGYRRFKIVAQHRVPQQRAPMPAREGRDLSWEFAYGCSGLFGEETPGPWLSEAAALRAYRWIFLKYRLIGDRSLIANTPWEKRLIRRGIEAGWYDTHAALT